MQTFVIWIALMMVVWAVGDVEKAIKEQTTAIERCGSGTGIKRPSFDLTTSVNVL